MQAPGLHAGAIETALFLPETALLRPQTGLNQAKRASLSPFGLLPWLLRAGSGCPVKGLKRPQTAKTGRTGRVCSVLHAGA